MKSFNQFITEAYDKEMAGQASRAPGEGGRIRASRKKRELDKTRTRQQEEERLHQQKIINLVKILVLTNQDHALNNNQKGKEVLPHYLLEKHNARQQWKEEQQRRVLKLKQQMSCYLRRRKLYLLSINQ